MAFNDSDSNRRVEERARGQDMKQGVTDIQSLCVCGF